MHFNRATALKNRPIVSCKSLIEICAYNWLLFCALAILACYWFESECSLEGYFAWNTAPQQNVPPFFNNIIVEIPSFGKMINTALWTRICYEFVSVRNQIAGLRNLTILYVCTFPKKQFYLTCPPEKDTVAQEHIHSLKATPSCYQKTVRAARLARVASQGTRKRYSARCIFCYHRVLQ